MIPTPEQQKIIEHDSTKNGRILAGPGTGKSWTSVSLIGRLLETHPEINIRLLTFTRAATQELEKKVNKANIVFKPSTIHSFALSLLLHSSEVTSFPRPLRIPDTWEVEKLIRPDIARRLRRRGFSKVRKNTIKELEHELSAQWQSLEQGVKLLADIDPYLRNAYVGLWDQHRCAFGYTLLAELPYRAVSAIEDLDIPVEPTDLLVVDEYQDLNEADIRLIRLLHNKGAKVIAIGDDDQSIYRFRMAAPEGIRRFPIEFGNCQDYKLTISQRCGENILNAATTVIETAPDRPKKASLTFKRETPPGSFYYLRFENDEEEIIGAADIIQARHKAGIPLGEIAVLVRSQVPTWANLLILELTKRDIDAVDTDWIMSEFQNNAVRRGLARLRLIIDRKDSLAWWTLIKLHRGISPEFYDYVYEFANGQKEKFGESLLRLYPNFPDAPTSNSAKVASQLIAKLIEDIDKIDLNNVVLDETGWGGWVLNQIGRPQFTDDAIKIFERIGRDIPVKNGLGYFLGQLEPTARDLTTQSDAVRIMTITKSKGLTVNTCIVMGVEEGIIPHPKGDEGEERRLLYVAITRATEMSILTFAHRRTGPTARQGIPNVNRPRGRCTLLENLPIGQYQNGKDVILRLQQDAKVKVDYH